ncbi:MAG: N-acetylmuramoyl-L-alanine amidase [Chloroflexota bacterium]|nr:N-acetylmuramoyl-L-alanine amidase [Chloroflexota bacterium]
MPSRQGSTAISSRLVIVLGAVLLAGLTILAFAGGRLFGSAAVPLPAGGGTAPIVASGFPTPSASPDTWAAAGPAIPTATIRDGEPVPTVCLDPGHGGPDNGFTQFWSELGFVLVEKNLVLEHAWDLEARLKRHGYDVVMTRRTDVAVNASGIDVNGDGRTEIDDTPGTNQQRNRNLDELQARINICNEADADLLVSMHVNGFTNTIPRGYEIWYTEEREFGDQNLEFAILAYDALKRHLADIGYTVEVERGVNPDTAANVDTPNTAYRHFIMIGPAAPGAIEPSAMPGAIVEALFVSNDLDAAILVSPSGRDAIVSAYEEAIIQYFAEYPPG